MSDAALPAPGFWSDRRVFLTGHTGFKGTWLSLWLQSLGAKVTGYALEPATAPALFDLAAAARQMDSLFGDVRDLERLSSALRAAAPEVVIHLAAQPLVRQSYADPVGTYATNVMGTVHLLEAVRKTPSVRAVVVVTSDKCYENREWLWSYREDETLGGFDPYSNSKACVELVAKSFRDSFFPADRHASHGVAVASARAGNVIGGGDWSADRLIPDFLRAAQAGTNRDVNLDIGESVFVDAWNPDGTATVRYRGAQWTVVQRAGHAPSTGEHRVVEIVGSRLVVDKA